MLSTIMDLLRAVLLRKQGTEDEKDKGSRWGSQGRTVERATGRRRRRVWADGRPSIGRGRKGVTRRLEPEPDGGCLRTYADRTSSES
jgi:hypothetical protein